MYKTKEMNAIFKKPSKDRLYVDRPVEGQVRVTNGHWMVHLLEREIAPEFVGYFANENGKVVRWMDGRQDTFEMDLGRVFTPEKAQFQLSITDEIQHTRGTKLRKRVLRDKNEVPYYVDDSYLDLICGLFGDKLNIKGESPTRPIYLFVETHPIAVLMPIVLPLYSRVR